MKKSLITLGVICAVFTMLAVVQSSNAQRGLNRPQIWADCTLYDGVVSAGNFDPANGPFDELYAGGSGFQNGAPLISDSKPGDMDYNGGRWHLNVLKSGVAADKYANACSAADLDPNDFESTSDYFECPMIPRR